ncbi:RIP metalloprotease RseP [Patescibacteria group bacterium]|nr:RIP metalloprotease RseP [Patescibacteria group bacterium]MBU1613405.1 RIP metalloprotease RseP [Patescibacteria group bacterium]
MITLIIFIAILAILVLSHEFGHFIVARKNGIKVDEFGFGFPPRILGIQFFKEIKLEKIAEQEKIEVETKEEAGVLKETVTDTIHEIDKVTQSRKWRIVWGNKAVEKLREENAGREGTIYSLNWIPLGGFVRIKGEDGENAQDPDSFGSKKPWQRALVLVAGVAMNILLAAVLLSVGYMVGLPQMTDQLSSETKVKDRRVEIMQVIPGKPAEQAGLEAGDVVVKLNNLENPRLKEMQKYVDDHRDEKISVTVRRENEMITKSIQPVVYEETGKGGLGVAIAEVGMVSYPWYQAIYYGFLTSFLYLKEIIVAFALFIKGLFEGAGVGGEVTGPVGIAVMTGRVARLGFAYLVQFTAVLSLNLAIINILPIPALDGGRLLFLLIAKIRGKENNKNVEQLVHTIGFALLLLLIVAVTFHDLRAFGGVFTNAFKKIF